MTGPKLLKDVVQAWWSEQDHQAEIYVGGWPPWQDAYIREPFGWQGSRTNRDLIRELSSRLTSSTVVAAQVLNDPKMRVAMEIIEVLLPPPTSEEVQFLADLITAAGTRSVAKRNWALVGAFLIAISLALAASKDE